jgi:hypothetical protein
VKLTPHEFLADIALVPVQRRADTR